MIELHSCKADAAHWLNEFYQNSGYSRPASGEDDVYYAEKNSRKIGVLRISKEHGHSVLRGMQVLDAYRGQGIGTQLLSFLENFLEADPVYCIPRDHLVEFYGKIGFSVINSDEAPEFLANRLDRYIEDGLNVLLMKRESIL